MMMVVDGYRWVYAPLPYRENMTKPSWQFDDFLLEMLCEKGCLDQWRAWI